MSRPQLTRSEVNRRYAAAELTLEVAAAKRIRRTPAVLISLLALLVAGVGLVSSADLRRLQTPRGTALAWTEAAVFGDCRGYQKLSLAPPADVLVVDRRSGEQRCTDLRRSTEDARLHSGSIRLDAVSVQRPGATAAVQVRLVRAGAERTVLLSLVRRGAGWAVLRDGSACAQIGSA